MRCALGIVVAVLVGFLPNAWAQGTDTPGTPPQQQAPAANEGAASAPPQALWGTRCATDSRGGTLDCAVEQRMFLTQTGQLVATVTVRVPADTRSPVIMVQVPLGLFLPAGIKLSIDGGAEEAMPLQTCEASGCYAGGQISENLLSSLKRGATLSIKFENLQRQPVTVPVQLTGFTAAYSRIE
jgi:invasion protein IalB